MSLSTPEFLRRAASLLAAISLSLGAQAQTAPAWSQVRGLGTPPVNYGGNVVVDAAGNTYQAGTFNRTLTLDGISITSVGSEDVYLAKYTPAGTLAWLRQIGGLGADGAGDLALDASGDVYVSGTFLRAISLSPTVQLSAGTTTAGKVFVVRYSPQGDPVWAQQSSSSATAPALSTDARGHLYLAGQFTANLTLGSQTLATNGSFSIFLARLSAATGAVESLGRATHYLPPAGPTHWTYGTQLAAAPTGEVYLYTTFSEGMVYATATVPANTNGNVVIARYDAQGVNEWVRTINCPAGTGSNSGVVDGAGNLYLAGILAGPATIGSTAVPNRGGVDVYLAKYAPLGALQWVQSAGGSGEDRWGSLVLDAAGNPYLIGTFEATAQFGPLSLTSAGGSDVVVAAYSAQGAPRWVQQAGGPGPDAGSALGLDGAGNAYALGTFNLTATFAPLAVNTSATSIFIARLGNAALGTRAGRPQAVGIFPTPAHDLVQLPGLAAGSRVQLLDALGRVARETTVTPAAQVSVLGLAPGLYTLRATDAQGQQYAARVAVD